MGLYHFHRVLITCAILFDFCFSFWAVKKWQVNGDTMLIVAAVGTSVVSVGLIAYLVYFNRSLAMIRTLATHRRNQVVN